MEEQTEPLSNFGEFYETKIKEGYSEKATGSGPWVGSQRVLYIAAFYHPNGEISTYQEPKARDHTGRSFHPHSFEMAFSSKEFDEYISKFSIKMSKKSALEEILL